jgi:hypothetical protein
MNPNEIVTRPRNEHDSLRPCPFCEWEEIVYSACEPVPGHGLRWCVTCCGCMATINPGYAQNRHVVRDMWNRRAADQDNA